MKTGYVYIASVNGRFGPVLRLGISMRHPIDELTQLARRSPRRGKPKLIGYEFVEDIALARTQIAAELGGRRTLRANPVRAKAALKRLAQRQAGIRKARFHPETGLLVDPDVDLSSGPIAAFSAHLAGILSQDAEGDMRKLDLFLHPYMVGTIATLFREKQAATKIPDEYLPEILRDIAWRVWRCRLKPAVFMRMAQRTRREQNYLDLARYTLERGAKPRRRTRLSAFATHGQLTAFMRAPTAHLKQTMSGYVDALDKAPVVKVKGLAVRLGQAVLALAVIFVVDAMITSLDFGAGPGLWLSALLMVFFAGAAALTFNLYDLPDLTRGLGIVTRREVEAELKAIEGAGSRPR